MSAPRLVFPGNIMRWAADISREIDRISELVLPKVAFLAYNSANDTDVTGTAGTGFVTVDFDTEVFDTGNDFSADTFTAPVTGRYYLSTAVQMTGITAAADVIQVKIVTSNRTYLSSWAETDDILATMTLEVNALADMDAGDTATVQAIVTGEATDVVDIVGSGNTVTRFSGVLVA